MAISLELTKSRSHFTATSCQLQASLEHETKLANDALNGSGCLMACEKGLMARL